MNSFAFTDPYRCHGVTVAAYCAESLLQCMVRVLCSMCSHVFQDKVDVRLYMLFYGGEI